MTKNDLHAKGWSIRAAAKHLGCTQPHLSMVLSGQRVSHILIKKLKGLPKINPGKHTAKQIATK